MSFLLQLLILISQALTWILFIYVILSWVLPPHHSARQVLGRLVDPLLNPIRNLLPQTGTFDFSVIVLFIFLQIIETVATQTLRSF